MLHIITVIFSLKKIFKSPFSGMKSGNFTPIFFHEVTYSSISLPQTFLLLKKIYVHEVISVTYLHVVGYAGGEL